MSAVAIFFLKSPSLLAFDDERHTNGSNLRAWFGMKDIPCDTRMREILDPVDPTVLRPAFTDIFRHLQRGKALEKFVWMQGHYLLLSDGTTYFSSDKIHCPRCLQKRNCNGVTTYYHQMLGMALAHPDRSEVIPLCPEPIIKQDGTDKGDGERSATRRALGYFRREHPHLKVIIVEDALSSEGPHIRDLQQANIRFILGVKAGKQTHLFEQMEEAEVAGRVQILTQMDADGTLHHFRWITDAALNKTHPDIKVGMLDYWSIGKKTRHFTWITDWELNEQTVDDIARGGRARWHIENETFNTLKNQGYHFDRNFGHGEESLSTIFALLMFLVFLVDQSQQLCDELFRRACDTARNKRGHWERLRSLFLCFQFATVRELYETLLTFKPIQRPLDTG
jgi:hypothetical protein